MRIGMMAVMAAGVLAACYTDVDRSKLRRPSSWSQADGRKVEDTFTFMRNAELCDDIAERTAVKRLPINDPGDTGWVMRQRRLETDSGFYRCMVSFDWRPRGVADEAVGLKPHVDFDFTKPQPREDAIKIEVVTPSGPEVKVDPAVVGYLLAGFVLVTFGAGLYFIFVPRHARRFGRWLSATVPWRGRRRSPPVNPDWTAWGP